MSFDEACGVLACTGPVVLGAGYFLYASRERARRELDVFRAEYSERLASAEHGLVETRSRLAQVERVLGERARAEAAGEVYGRSAAATSPYAAPGPALEAPSQYAAPAPALEAPSQYAAPAQSPAPTAYGPPAPYAPAPYPIQQAVPDAAPQWDPYATFRRPEHAQVDPSAPAPMSAPTPEAPAQWRTGDPYAPVDASAPAAPTPWATASPGTTPYPAPSIESSAPARSSSAMLEEWLGLRGAAALGAIVLVIAAAYFFKYSIEHGLISPLVRLLLGSLVGFSCLAVSESSLQQKNKTLAQFLGGAGSAILYFAAWAAAAVYALIPYAAAFVAMALVTALTCALAWRRDSMPTAVLGLLGGFTSPLLLSTGADHPITLFAYIGLLDVGLLVLARRMRWPGLVLASVVLTVFYELAWIFGRMGPGRIGLGGSFLVAFGLLFAVFARMPPAEGDANAQEEDPLTLRIARVVGLAAGALFALNLATAAKFGPHFAPVAVVLFILTVGALVLATRDRAAWLAAAAAAIAVPTVLAFQISRPLTGIQAWEVNGALVVLGLTHLLAGVVHAARSGMPTDRPRGALVLAYGALVALWLQAGAATFSAAPLIVALVVVYGLVLAEAALIETPQHLALVPAFATLVLATGDGTHANQVGWPHAGIVIAVFVLVLVAAASRTYASDEPTRRFSAYGVVGAALVLCFHAVADLRPAVSIVGQASLLALALAFGMHASARLARGAPLVLLAILSMPAWWVVASEMKDASIPARAFAIGIAALVILAFTGLPRLAYSLRTNVAAHRAAALAVYGPIVPCFALYKATVGTHGGGLIALAAALPLASLTLVVHRDDTLEPGARTSMLAWLAASTSMLVSLAIGIELRKEWLTIAFAVQGAIMLGLFRKIDHLGLKTIASALFGVVFLRLASNGELLRYHASRGIPVFNWLLYTYATPIAAMVVAIRLHADIEVARQRPFERTLTGGKPALSAALGLASLVLGFVWINLTVVDAFSTARTLSLTFERLPARDLTLSGAWALYALVVVALGIRLRSVPLRLASMLMLLLTIGKVFLYDIGALSDLYRVASLVGLALTLIVVSLAYQRFVFRKT